jgi:RimJ/RimL family protein N-acetyltransferase
MQPMHTVELRAVTDDDLPIFFEHQRDPAATTMAAFPARERDDFMEHWTAILADRTLFTRTVLVEGVVAGNVVSWEHDGERDVGYWIGREHWGRGIATAALRLSLEEITARPLHAHVARSNVASIRVLEKCGFIRVREDGDEYLLVLWSPPGP